jgi:hypothetical protein
MDGILKISSESLGSYISATDFSGGPSSLTPSITFVCRETAQPSGMRLFRALPALSLLLGARASFLDSHQPVPHRLEVRDTPDVCAAGPFNISQTSPICEI